MSYLTTAIFWVVTQGVVVISYRRFGTTNPLHLEGSRIQNSFRSLNPEDEKNWLFRNIGKKLTSLAA